MVKPDYSRHIGKRFGALVVLAFVRTVPHGRTRIHHTPVYLCRCDCGRQREVMMGNLLRGHTTSCGCEGRKRQIASATTHGMTGTATYECWNDMRSRCHDPEDQAFKNYGARGIAVCAGWRDSFEAFFASMGARPEKLTLERIDNNRGYDCGCCDDCVARGAAANVRWATRTEQANNRRSNRLITFADRTMTLREWSRETGISEPLLHHRLGELGWSIEQALTTPRGAGKRNLRPKVGRMLTHEGRTMNFAGWERETGISASTIKARLDKLGWSVHDALTKPAVLGNN